MRTKIVRNILISVGLLFALARLVAAGTIITFDAPGAGTGPTLGTEPLAINPAGVITGLYADASNALHGFVRATNGAMTTFDVPGGGTGSDEGTSPRCINPGGVIAGIVIDPGFSAVHGFVRAASGAITTFDVPGAVFTIAQNINPEGVIAGTYLDASFLGHGFVRAANGTITTFDVPEAGTGPGQGTFPGLIDCLNPAGVITGFYTDANSASHGFVRAANGTITTFDAPGAVNGTFPLSINPMGTVTGNYNDASFEPHGFVRALNALSQPSTLRARAASRALSLLPSTRRA
jgi:predicted membrane protein